METYNNRFGKRIISNLIEPPCSKKQKTTSLLKLCENEEWDFIIEFAQDMIQVWDVEVQVFKNPLHVCSSKGALNVMQHLLKLKMFKPEDLGQKNRFNNSCVALAAENGHLETVKWLNENGLSINSDKNHTGNSCLLIADKNGHLETVKWLIENGCSIHERNNRSHQHWYLL